MKTITTDLTGFTSYACALPFHHWMSSEVLQGIECWSQETGLHFQPFHMMDTLNVRQQPWISGLLAFLAKPSHLRLMESMTCPIVNLSGNMDQCQFPSVLSDSREMGRLAAEHLISCGATRILYVSFEVWRKGFRHQRRKGVEQACVNHQIPFQPYILRKNLMTNRQVRISSEEAFCKQWMDKEPVPMAVITESPVEAWVLSQLANIRGWTLGKELALFQLTDRREVQSLTDPDISFIANDWKRIGYTAADLLHTWVTQGTPPPSITWIPPLPGVLTSSSDASHSSGLFTRFRSHLVHSTELGLQVAEVAHELGVSQTTLVKEVKRASGTTPKAILMERQLKEVKRLLRDTLLPIEEISARCGYGTVHSLNAAFRRQENVPPGQWRRKQSSHASSPETARV